MKALVASILGDSPDAYFSFDPLPLGLRVRRFPEVRSVWALGGG